VIARARRSTAECGEHDKQWYPFSACDSNHGEYCDLPNVEGQPRGDCGRAVFSDDKADPGGLALSEAAGPIPALCCGDLLGSFFVLEPPFR
jgi:hypothetical protein